MKRTLAILLALMMVLSTISFAAPVAVSTVTTAEETAEQDYSVQEETAEVTGETDTVDWVDDTYGNLVFSLDFEKSDSFTENDKMSKHGAVNTKYSSYADWWIKQSSCGTIKIAADSDGNSYLNVGNGTANNSQIMFESGTAAISGNLSTYIGENGYYTYLYDLRYHTDTPFKYVTNQSFYRYSKPDTDTWSYHAVYGPDTAASALTAGEWKNIKVSLSVKEATDKNVLDSLYRFRPVVFYTETPAAKDKYSFDLDNVKLYYKPFSVNVTVLGNENVQDLTLKFDIPADTLKSVYTKAELLNLVNDGSTTKCVDLTLEDGTAFEKLDVVEFNRIKGVYKIYQTSHPDYGTLLYEIDFETATPWQNAQKASSQGFVNTAFTGSENWNLRASQAALGEKVTENGNSFFRLHNNTNRYPQFQVMSLEPASGVYTQENGYYTVIADVRADISGTAGEDFDIFFTQNIFQIGSTTGNIDETKTNQAALTAGGFVTTQATMCKDGADALRRTNYVFRYAGDDITNTKVDTFDVDNLKLYFKPKNVTVKILGDESLSIPEQSVKVSTSDISYVVNKDDILAHVETDDDVRIVDITLADGTAFETVDLDSNTTFKAVYNKVDMYDDTYGHLMYYIDFETVNDYAAYQRITDQGIVNSDFDGSDMWCINAFAYSSEKVTVDGNSFIRMTNPTGQHGTQFNVLSLNLNEGVFTSENGYYTVFADVRADVSGEAGDDFNYVWDQPIHVVNGSAVSGNSATFIPTKEFATSKMLLFHEGAQALRRHRHIFSYKTTAGATVADVDTFDIDNLKMYFKPVSVDVTVLAGDNADFEAQTVTVAIDKDTLDSTITKAELMALVENDTDLVLGDLTLEDGSAFEAIDVMKITKVKAVWLSKAPKSSNASSMRIKDPAGIRFKASISTEYKLADTEYGFLVTRSVLLGTQDADTALRFGNEDNLLFLKGVNYGYDAAAGKNVDKIFELSNNEVFFTAVVYGIPATAEGYSDTLVVRPYYKDVKGEYHYGAPVSKSVKDTAIAIRDAGYSGLDTYGIEYIQGVLKTCGESI